MKRGDTLKELVRKGAAELLEPSLHRVEFGGVRRKMHEAYVFWMSDVFGVVAWGVVEHEYDGAFRVF